MKKLLLLNLLALFLISCGSQKYLPVGAPPIIKEKSFFQEIERAENKMKSLSFKANASFEKDGSNQSFRLQIRLIKDSVVWLDISDPFLGIKLARAVVYKDSIAFINKLQRQYFTGKPSDLSQRIDLDLNFNLLQNMLSANIIFPVNKKDFELYFGKDEYILADYEYQKDSLILESSDESRLIKFYPKSKKPSEQVFTDKGLQQNYNLYFSNFKKIDSLNFPEKILISYSDGGKKSSLQLKDIKNIQVNVENNLPFNIPSNYERMP